MWAMQGDQAIPKPSMDVEPSLPSMPTLARLASVHDRITKGFAPYEEPPAPYMGRDTSRSIISPSR